MNLGILDLKIGNLKSIIFMIKKLPLKINIYLINNNFKDFKKIDKMIIPGQGSNFNLIKNILLFDNLKGFFDLIKNKEILGICIGKQIFFNKSEEFNCTGFKILNGFIKKFLFSKKTYKIPNIGWNKINLIKNHFLLYNLNFSNLFYFSHSFYLNCFEKESILGITKHNFIFSSLYLKNNLFLTQFHPEKSGGNGFNIFYNFCNWKV